MPRAVGCSQTLFSSKKIGNLCRGKEWWIETELTPREVSLQRTIISGVELQDERARSAKRGLSHCGLSIADFIQLLGVDQNIVAYVEDSFPTQIPQDASGIEHYQMSKLGFSLNSWFARWERTCNTLESINEALNYGADLFLLNPTPPEQDESSGFVKKVPDQYGQPSAPSVLNETLKRDSYRLIGARQNHNATARFLADALWDVLNNCQAVIVLHEDKHSRCLGVYAKDDLGFAEKIERFCEQSGILFVPFSIPPMLARWDRAIRDLRREWNESEKGLFPIPVSTEQEELSEQDSDDQAELSIEE